MADGFSLIVLLIAAAAFTSGTLVVMSIRHSKPHRKWFYILLLFNELGWFSIVGELFPLVGVPRVWEDGVEGVLLALVVPTLVLVYRHRHAPDLDEI